MSRRDDKKIFTRLSEEYARFAPKSAALNRRTLQTMVDGGSHALRLMEPFPPRIVEARGAWLVDEDDHRILDYWQGHLGNILGHNPPVIGQALAEAFATGSGLTTGMTERAQIEVAELLCRQTGAERVRFTTSGALATMYAVMLARAFTGRSLVLKVGGGWHGAQPWGLVGVSYQGGFQKVESEGLPPGVAGEVIVSGFNDLEQLQDVFQRWGERTACFIVEPFIGAGGSIPATREYLVEAARLCRKYGALLILDEVIAGFRFRAGDLGGLYGIKPDLATFGKIIGGGMPVAAVAGRADVLGLVGREAGSRVKFSGGTFSAHPGAMLAGKAMLTHLVEREAEIYPRLAQVGELTRRALESAFTQEGILACCTGHNPDVLPGSSLFRVHFPYQPEEDLQRPDVVNDPDRFDVALSGKILDLALLLENVYLPHAHGAVSTDHTEEDVDFLRQACMRAARRIMVGKD